MTKCHRLWSQPKSQLCSEPSYPNHELSVTGFNLIVIGADVSAVNSHRSLHVTRLQNTAEVAKKPQNWLFNLI